MRKRIAILLCLLPGLAFAAPAKPAGPPGLEDLFAKLKKADSPEAAHPIEQQLLERFQASGSASADLLMTRAAAALKVSDSKTALKLVTAVTGFAPAYAEAWHARASMEAASGNDAGALLSLQKTVLLNPRHFNALVELAAMVEDYGDKAGALKLYRRALALDPQLTEAARRVQALTKSVEGQDI